MKKSLLFAFVFLSVLLFNAGDTHADGVKVNPEYLKCVSLNETIVLDATDGSETFTGVKDVFLSINPLFIDGDVDMPSKPTAAIKVKVYEIIKDGTFNNFFIDFQKNIEQTSFTEDQTVSFCKKYSQTKWFDTKGCKIFLFKLSNKYCGGFAIKSSDGLDFYMQRPLLSDQLLHADNHNLIFIPQQ